MHCPKCGREEISAESRFCRNCGFEIEDVKLLVSDQANQRLEPALRTAAFNQGLGLMMISLVLVIVMTLLQDIDLVPQFAVKLVAGIFILAGLLRMFTPYLFHRSGPRTFESNSALPVNTAKLPLELPPERPSINISRDKAGIREPIPVPSVTEHTTRKLTSDE